nr:glycosyltransferase family 39 protein [Motilibacter deserti]
MIRTPLRPPLAAVAARPAFARRPVLLVAAGVVVLLLAVAPRYGYHRDELYFLRAGSEPAWGYPDQPPLTPLLAHAMDALVPGSLLALRTPSALLTGLTVVVAALTARELGGGRTAQLVAASSTAACAALLAVGHLLSTTTLDVAASALLVLLVARVLGGAGPRLLLAAGVVLGVGLQNKQLIGFVAAALVVGVAVAGPRWLLRCRAAWGGALAALLLWLPNLLWQARHGWPQLEMARVIRADADMGGREAFLPMQLVMLGPPLVPLALAGLVLLLRNPRLRAYRPLGVAVVVLVAAHLVLAGKPYYTAGVFPLVLSAGGVAAEQWLRAAAPASARRARVLAAAVAASGVVGALLVLPLVPVRWSAVPVAVSSDTGEQVGWPRLVAAVSGVWERIPEGERPGAVVLTANYGEAGAVDRYGASHGLPRAHSGHVGYAAWGPPRGDGPVVLVGFGDPGFVERYFADCALVAQVDNGVGVDNEEAGAPVHLCRGPVAPWPRLWPQLEHLG